MSAPRGRFAPSPTGDLHVGNASSALAAWLAVRAAGGAMVMRIEDLDRGRSRADFVERGLDDLEWLGLDWDEGARVGGAHAPYEQSARDALYEAAFDRLHAEGRLYPCFCSRRDIAAAASAPQEPGEERLYPGTCRPLDSAERATRIAAGAPHAWRFRVEHGEHDRFDDLVHGPLVAPETIGDFVVRRRDGGFAYQLAVVVDDVAMRIDQVVRGDDLVRSTFRQLAIYAALGERPPRHGHVPLVHGDDGARLSKRHGGVTLRELRAAGWSAEALVGWLARALGLRPTAEAVAPAALVDAFDFARIAAAPRPLTFDPAVERGGLQ